ncbi:Hypothetical predicted protein [Lecanosticta acicola]|uniref:Uncharacterized protein n=1 Tax=Lecanosticta acicola TaxID=111012 RepID=A0AAI8Z7R4_9PEZI|nr:Hypothetical predicted protein [Lecanosticta acicola]
MKTTTASLAVLSLATGAIGRPHAHNGMQDSPEAQQFNTTSGKRARDLLMVEEEYRLQYYQADGDEEPHACTTTAPTTLLPVTTTTPDVSSISSVMKNLNNVLPAMAAQGVDVASLIEQMGITTSMTGSAATQQVLTHKISSPSSPKSWHGYRVMDFKRPPVAQVTNVPGTHEDLKVKREDPISDVASNASTAEANTSTASTAIGSAVAKAVHVNAAMGVSSGCDSTTTGADMAPIGGALGGSFNRTTNCTFMTSAAAISTPAAVPRSMAHAPSFLTTVSGVASSFTPSRRELNSQPTGFAFFDHVPRTVPMAPASPLPANSTGTGSPLSDKRRHLVARDRSNSHGEHARNPRNEVVQGLMNTSTPNYLPKHRRRIFLPVPTHVGTIANTTSTDSGADASLGGTPVGDGSTSTEADESGSDDNTSEPGETVDATTAGNSAGSEDDVTAHDNKKNGTVASTVAERDTTSTGEADAKDYTNGTTSGFASGNDSANETGPSDYANGNAAEASSGNAASVQRNSTVATNTAAPEEMSSNDKMRRSLIANPDLGSSSSTDETASGAGSTGGNGTAQGTTAGSNSAVSDMMDGEESSNAASAGSGSAISNRNSESLSTSGTGSSAADPNHVGNGGISEESSNSTSYSGSSGLARRKYGAGSSQKTSIASPRSFRSRARALASDVELASSENVDTAQSDIKVRTPKGWGSSSSSNEPGSPQSQQSSDSAQNKCTSSSPCSSQIPAPIPSSSRTTSSTLSPTFPSVSATPTPNADFNSGPNSLGQAGGGATTSGGSEGHLSGAPSTGSGSGQNEYAGGNGRNQGSHGNTRGGSGDSNPGAAAQQQYGDFTGSSGVANSVAAASALGNSMGSGDAHSPFTGFGSNMNKAQGGSQTGSGPDPARSYNPESSSGGSYELETGSSQTYEKNTSSGQSGSGDDGSQSGSDQTSESDSMSGLSGSGGHGSGSGSDQSSESGSKSGQSGSDGGDGGDGGYASGTSRRSTSLPMRSNLGARSSLNGTDGSDEGLVNAFPQHQNASQLERREDEDDSVDAIQGRDAFRGSQFHSTPPGHVPSRRAPCEFAVSHRGRCIRRNRSVFSGWGFFDDADLLSKQHVLNNQEA